MKNILNKFEFHYSYLFIAVGFVLTGYFINLILYTSLIIIHELGHIIIMIHYNYNINKITIYPYGAIIKTNNRIDMNIDEELIVAISGLFSQTCFFLILIHFLSYKELKIFELYHYSMLILNIIPIYPLDGYKILNLCLNKFISFRLSNIISLIISIISLIILTILGFNNYSYYMIITLLSYNTLKLYLNLDYIYNRFLLEKYLYKSYYHKINIINKITKMKRNKINYLKTNNKLIKEDIIIKKMFDYK